MRSARPLLHGWFWLGWAGCAPPPASGIDDAQVWAIPATPQRSGDPDAGEAYLLYGDYVGSGIPEDLFREVLGEDPRNLLGRAGDSATLPAAFNLFAAPNGVSVVGGLNCFACHSSTLNGQFQVGLGESFSDFTEDETTSYVLLQTLISSRYGDGSPEQEAYARLGRNALLAAPHIVTPFLGLNPPFALEEAAVMYRDPQTLALQDTAQFALVHRVASDVPPWWNVRKKNALYYTAHGRGDLARLAMQVCVFGVWDTTHAEAIDAHFPDVLAWLSTLEPPPYPGEIDALLAAEGEALFVETCARCHGTYSRAAPDSETYPNLLVGVDEVGTDPALAEHDRDHPAFLDWLSASWFATEAPGAEFIAERGYIAPPLDGVWATAPYLHNGSVPTLAALLDSPTRPTRWRRDFDDTTYDLEQIGWPYEEVEAATSVAVYDTTVAGYGNAGHTYGDHLTPGERAALLVYLSSL